MLKRSLQAKDTQSLAVSVPDFCLLFEALPSAVLVVRPDDPTFTIVAANDAYVRATGIRRGDVLGCGAFAVFPDNPEDLNASGARNLGASFRRAIATRAPDLMSLQRYDIRRGAAETASFTERYWNVLNTPVFGADGAVEYLLHSVEDVTDQARALQRDAFLAQLDQAIGGRTDPHQLTNVAARHLNEHLQVDGVSFWKFEADQGAFYFLGGHAREGSKTLLGDAISQFGSGLAEALRGNRPYVDAWLGDTGKILATPIFKAGRLIAALAVFQFTAREWRPDEVELIQIVGNRCSETIERARAENALVHQWRTFDTALSQTLDFIYAFDRAGRFTYANGPLLALWKTSLEEAVGKNTLELGYPPELAERIQRQVQQVIETKQPVRGETPFAGSSGEIRNYEYIFLPVFGKGGDVEAVAGSTRDVTERSKAEEARRKAEERLMFALEAGGGIGTWDWDVTADRVYVNERFAELFSIDRERAAEGAPIAEFLSGIHAEDRTEVAEKIKQTAETGGQYTAEYRVLHKNGEVQWVHARGRGHLDQDGKGRRFNGVVFDISERKRAEKRDAFLVGLDDALRPLTEPDEIVKASAGRLGEHLQVDRSVYCLFEPDEDTFEITTASLRPGVPAFSGRHRLTEFGEQAAHLFRANLALVVDDVESDLGSFDGIAAYRQVNIRAHASVPLIKAGRLRAAMGFHHLRPRHWRPDEVELIQLVVNRCWESLERARVEAELRQQWRTFDTALSHTLDFIYIFDREGRFTYANSALLSLWQKSLEEAVGRNFFELGYPPELAERLQTQVQRVIDTKEPLRDHTPFKGPDGTTRDYEYLFAPVLGADGQVDLVAGSTRDITDRQRAEERLKASVLERDVLLYEVHHRVKNNLQVIVSLLDLQSDQITDSALIGAFQDMQTRVRAIAGIHETLCRSVDLARIDFDRYLQQLVGDLFSLYLENDQIRPVLRLESVDLEITQAIPVGLIVNELVTNCLKYAFPHGRTGQVGVEFGYAGDGLAKLRVWDDGQGLPADFDQRKSESMGMKLVQILTEQLNGRLQRNGTVGTEFQIEFPILARSGAEG